MATLESALTLFAPQRFSAKAPISIKLHASTSHIFSSKSFFKTGRLCFQLCSTLQEVAPTEQTLEPIQPTDNVKKLYVVNLSWSLTAADITDLFAQCGTVTDVEVVLKFIIFSVTLASPLCFCNTP